MVSSVIKWTADKYGTIIELEPSWFESSFYPHSKTEFETTWKNAILAKKPFQFHSLISDVWYRIEGSPFFDNVGVVRQFSGYFINVNDEYREISDAQVKINRYKTALTSARIAHWDLLLETKMPSYLDDPAMIYGIPPEDVKHLSLFMDIVHPDDKAEVNDAIKKAAENGSIYTTEFRIIHPDGSLHWLLGKGKSHVAENGERHLVGINMDITDKKIAEIEVKDLQIQLLATFNQAAVGIAHVAPDGKLIRVNTKFAEITGYTQEELITKGFQEITHPEDLQTDLDLVQQVLEGKIENYTLEKRYIHKNGKIVWINLSVALVRHLDGRPNYFISVIEDISEIKEDQLAIKELTNELEIRVRTRTKELEEINSELEHFLYMISQNLKEPAQKIKINIARIQDKLENLINSTNRKYFDDIVTCSTSLNQMAQNLLGLSRVKRGEIQFVPLRLNEIIDSAIHEIKSEFREEDITFHVDDMGEIYGNKFLLRQLFTSLIKHSHTRNEGTHSLIIEIGKKHPKGHIYYIKDNGQPLSNDELQNMFLMAGASDKEEFFSLYLCKTIIKRHKGKIWIESDAHGANVITFSLEMEP